ncbi:MAG: alpha/beta hydrolase [Bacteroidota bacterium]
MNLATSTQKRTFSGSTDPLRAEATAFFLAQPVRYAVTSGAEVAYRRFGSGPPVVFVHGWPFNGFTYRALAYRLRNAHTCIVIDLPGTGESRWSARTDFSFPGQAATLAEMATVLGLDRYAVVAHDTGASIARHLADPGSGPGQALDRARLDRLLLFNTEIPGHRPPWIPFYARLVHVPGAHRLFAPLFRTRAFRRAAMGFGGCYADLALLDGDFKRYVLDPVIASPTKARGLAKYLQGLDWARIDDFARLHPTLDLPVRLVWGAADPTFPVELGRAMAATFPACAGFTAIPHAKLLVYDEFAEAVYPHVATFLTA